MRIRSSSLMALLLVVPLSGCNWIMNLSGLNAEAHKALGASCRQTGRSLEECFSRHAEADRAQIYAGWKEMNEYMTKNKLPNVAPLPDPPPPVAPPPRRVNPETGMEEKLDPEVEAVMKSVGSRRIEEERVRQSKDERLISIIEGKTAAPDPENFKGI